MQCPACKDSQLVISERQRIEIDYCPSCRGVWLDRGELDKLIERSSADQPSTSVQNQQPQTQRNDYRPDYQRKQKSWLSDIFD